jgi:uncharacterized protein YhbP (UPF0306 family)
MGRNQENLRRAILAYLEEHRVMTLATSGVDGPWAAAVFYANQGFDLYFISASNTRHGQYLALNSRAAATIQEEYLDWPDIKGIQLEGTVSKLSGDDRSMAMDSYRKKFPFIDSAGAQIQSAFKRISWYRLKPDRLYFIDNSRGLGHRDLVDLDSGA